ncbi:MAG: ferritin family protein [Deltaproteobacteria bacterium]|jgi:rubrerythrin|nr:ferritin family protein [Deltaproteobacteria bacterium]
MASFVNAADVIASAVEIERRGHKFYQQAEQAAAGKEAKEFFAFMAGEELKHEKLFASMLERVGGLELPTGSTDQEYLAYVEATLDSHMLFTIGGIPANLDGRDPFIAALGFEKDTIVYFLAMLDLLPESEQHHVVQCIDEEKRHIVLIHNKRKALKK